jgi:hypothetical protein
MRRKKEGFQLTASSCSEYQKLQLRSVELPVAKNKQLRKCELETAVKETRTDMKNGRFHIESAGKHITRIRQS